VEEVWITKREICLALTLSVLVIVFAVYSNIENIGERYSAVNFGADETRSKSYGGFSSTGSQQYSKVISETIEGELNKGAFEDVIGELEVLTDYMEGYVKSLRMTYQDGVWSGIMICKVPPTNITSFTFSARATIEANGTVTYIDISMESINASQQNQESKYSTINLYLKEIKPQNGKNEIIASIASALPILTTSLVWIAEGLIIGVPLCLASLGIVILVNRGIVPLWKNTLRKPK
jgi:hypothetical protein